MDLRKAPVELKREVKAERLGKSDIRVSQEIVQNNVPLMAMNKALREIPNRMRSAFGKECRLVAVIPFYGPDGMFDPATHAANMDPDQLKYLLEKCPEFNCEVVASKPHAGHVLIRE